MKKNNLYSMFAFLSMVMLIFVVIIHIRFVILPVFFLVLGLLSYLWSHRKALVLFLFLLPLINSTPDIFFNGYPFNYMGVALFYLSGIMIASRLKKEKPEIVFPGHGLYLLFLFILSVSVLFVFLRWSNLTLSSLAFLRDTPVAPSGERLSFACIFPVITLALFSLSPFLASLIRFWHLKENEIFTPLKAGFCLSFLLALVQKWLDPDFLAQSWWELNMHQVNGGFSDFNAFGFFAGAMFLYQALRLINKSPRRSDIATQDKTESSDGIPHSLGFKTWGFENLFLLIALAAIFISGCRAAFLFVLLAVIYLIFSRRTSFRVKAPVVLLLAGFLLVAGGSLKKRLQQTTWQAARLTDSADLFAAADEVSSGRLSMLKDSVRMIARFPVSGIGAGNFLFYLKTLRFGETFYEDLPLNQYLLITSETGLAAGLLFFLFLFAQLKWQKPSVIRFVLAAIAFALFFNNFFWFPECLLLFWIFVAGNDRCGEPEPRWWSGMQWVLVIGFIAFNVADFPALHPKTLIREKGAVYDYGFWPREKNERGAFSWTGRAAGKYIAVNDDRDFSFLCEAPQSWLQKEGMAVELFWRGKLFQREVFFKNQLKKFLLPRGQEGFLELRIKPTFNLKKMKISDDPRELGVQLVDMSVKFNSPSQRKILPEVIWAAATGGGIWMSNVQVTDVSGGSQVYVYYNTASGRRGPFLLWDNTAGAALSSVKYSNLLQTIDGLDTETFTYYGTVGAVEFISQDGSHLLQAAARTLNGSYAKTFTALSLHDANTADTSRAMIVSNLSNNATYRSTCGFFNPTADEVTVEFTLLNSSGGQVGTQFSKTFAGHEFQAFDPFTLAGVPYPDNSYDSVILRVRPTSGAGQVMCFGATANNTSNDPAAHVAVQGASGYDNGPGSRQILPEAIWASATGGGTWMSNVQVTDVTGGSQVSVYYNTASGRRGPFLLWDNTAGGALSSVKYSNLLETIDGLDTETFTYYGTVGAVEFISQDGSHLLQAAARTLNGNYAKTLSGLNLVNAETADTSRVMLIQNYTNNSSYRSTCGFFNPTADAVTVEFTLLDGGGAQIGSQFSKTLAGYNFQAFNPFIQAGVPYSTYSYDNIILRMRPTAGAGSVMCFGATVDNTSNDPAAHLAVQGQ